MMERGSFAFIRISGGQRSPVAGDQSFALAILRRLQGHFSGE